VLKSLHPVVVVWDFEGGWKRKNKFGSQTIGFAYLSFRLIFCMMPRKSLLSGRTAEKTIAGIFFIFITFS